MDNDVTTAEQTADSPSEEIKAEVESTEQSEETTQEVGHGVPYSRFNELTRKYKELLSVQQEVKPSQKSSAELAKEIEASTGQSYDDALKVVDTRASEIIRKELAQRDRQADLDKAINTYPDFYKFADAIKAKVQENPSISWSDAYKSVHYDVARLEAEKIGQEKAYKKQQEKKGASVETAAKAKPINTDTGTIDPLAKGPDGKFLYSTKELEDILKN